MVDGDANKVARLRATTSLTRVQTLVAMVTAENINDILRDAGLEGELDPLSIDIDGNDLWIWEAIDVADPRLVVIEYNSTFGPERSVTIHYDPAYTRSGFGAYYGASLRALVHSGRRRGYRLVAVEPRGVNAFFARAHIAPELPRSIPPTRSACSRRPSGACARRVLTSMPSSSAAGSSSLRSSRPDRRRASSRSRAPGCPRRSCAAARHASRPRPRRRSNARPP